MVSILLRMSADYDFSSNNTLTHTDSSGNKSSAGIAMSIGLLNVGVELGYQFVIAKRFIIDAEMFGPSFTYYSFKANIDGNISGSSQSETITGSYIGRAESKISPTKRFIKL